MPNFREIHADEVPLKVAEQATLAYAMYADPCSGALSLELIEDNLTDTVEGEEIREGFDRAIAEFRSEMIWIVAAAHAIGFSSRSIRVQLKRIASSDEESISDAIVRLIGVAISGFVEQLARGTYQADERDDESIACGFSGGFGSLQLSSRIVDANRCGCIYCPIDAVYQFTGPDDRHAPHDFVVRVNAIAHYVQNGIRTHDDIALEAGWHWLLLALAFDGDDLGWAILEESVPPKFDNLLKVAVEEEAEEQADAPEVVGEGGVLTHVDQKQAAIDGLIAFGQLDVDGQHQVLSQMERSSVNALGKSIRHHLKLSDQTVAFSPVIDKPIEEAYVHGFGQLTRDELRKLQTFAANRLKEKGFDQRVKERAIADDIFPLAQVLFPDRIASPSDVDADSLTALFREKAEDPAASTNPLSEEQLAAIKDLSQAWKRDFGNILLNGIPVSASKAGRQGLKFREIGGKRASVATTRFWPGIIFPKPA